MSIDNYYYISYFSLSNINSMENPNQASTNEIIEELNTQIKKLRKWEYLDSSFAHTFLWISIIASFVSSILIAYDKIPDNFKIIVAIIAGIPALTIVIGRTFDFAARSIWDTMFRLELEIIKDEMALNGLSAYQGAKLLRETNKKFESDYTKIGFFGDQKNQQTEVGSTTPTPSTDPIQDTL